MKSKIEFWTTKTDKLRFVELCKKCGCTVAEMMRRAFEAKLQELETKCKERS